MLPFHGYYPILIDVLVPRYFVRGKTKVPSTNTIPRLVAEKLIANAGDTQTESGVPTERNILAVDAVIFGLKDRDSIGEAIIVQRK